MVNLFSKRYHGFARYTDEYSRPSVPDNTGRQQALNSANLAAAAAIAMYSKSTAGSPAPPRAHVQTNRASSLSNYERSNSMRTYTYTPKPSYHTGPVHHPSRRASSFQGSSMHSGSLRGPRPQLYHGNAERTSLHEIDDALETDSVVVTTRTTKVVDLMGRTKSITTEKIRTLPDGSNIIETKTTNISRPTLRSNSLRSNSLRANLLGMSSAQYNLDKIDEDLHDFDYTYLDLEDRAPPRLNGSVQESPRFKKYIQEQQLALTQANHVPERMALFLSSQSPKRLKSILKNSADIDTQDSQMAPSSRLGPAASITSGGASIKFRETVETISYPAETDLAAILRENSLKIEDEEKRNVDLYAKAMKVAIEKVYGPEQDTPASPEPAQVDVETLAAKKLKKDHKRERVESGISKNYIYENHHRDFLMRSMRDTSTETHTSRKERAKEEKRILKEEERRNAELLKIAEKERREEEKRNAELSKIAEKERREEEKRNAELLKIAEKERRKEEKLKKKEKKLFGLFRRKRKDSTGTDSLVSPMRESHDLTNLDPHLAQSSLFPRSPRHARHQSEEFLLVSPQVKSVEHSHMATHGKLPDLSPEAHIATGVALASAVASGHPLNPAETPAVLSPVAESFELPIRRKLMDALAAASSNLESSMDFVDVPEYIDDDHEQIHAEMMSPESMPKTEIIDDLTPSPGADIAQHNDTNTPPLQELHSGDVSLHPLPEDQLPTLVAGANNHPKTVVDNPLSDARASMAIADFAGSSDTLAETSTDPVNEIDGTTVNHAVLTGSVLADVLPEPVVPSHVIADSADSTESETFKSATLDPYLMSESESVHEQKILPDSNIIESESVESTLPGSNLRTSVLPDADLPEPDEPILQEHLAKPSTKPEPKTITEPKLAHVPVVNEVTHVLIDVCDVNGDTLGHSKTETKAPSESKVHNSEVVQPEPLIRIPQVIPAAVGSSALSEESDRTLQPSDKVEQLNTAKAVQDTESIQLKPVNVLLDRGVNVLPDHGVHLLKPMTVAESENTQTKSENVLFKTTVSPLSTVVAAANKELDRTPRNEVSAITTENVEIETLARNVKAVPHDIPATVKVQDVPETMRENASLDHDAEAVAQLEEAHKHSTSESQDAGSKKHKLKKRGLRFKKMIDKYFINSYSR